MVQHMYVQHMMSQQLHTLDGVATAHAKRLVVVLREKEEHIHVACTCTCRRVCCIHESSASWSMRAHQRRFRHAC
jgi:hypothetical protein